LAEAADRVRRGAGRRVPIPDFTSRRDEIGDLSGALRDMTAELLDRLEAIERFAADVAHEIKNPLTSLKSAVETAARVEDPDQQKQLLAIVKDDVHRLDRLISDISHASRLDAELSRAETDEFDVAALVEDIATVHNQTAKEGQARVALRLSEDGPLRVHGVADQIAQVVRNLAGNAVSFSPAGAAIAIGAGREAAQVVITVEDEGPGIPEGKFAAIFDRFYTDRPEGQQWGTHSGLGLSISKQIVEAHGGTIVAENVTGEDGAVTGARFTIRLPAARG
jgi:two-component system sensor histidine kinase ChvG